MVENTLLFEDVNIGEILPRLQIAIDAALIVGGAVASRDFTPVHHSQKAAQDAGIDDIFMNILTSNGLMGSYVSNWAGPASVTHGIDLSLGAPNTPGQVMTLEGKVLQKNEESGLIEVEVTGMNDSSGLHMQGLVEIQIPRRQQS